jgi:hypothetical protein
MKCYVWDCNQKAIVFIKLTTGSSMELPCCERHASQFPIEYVRVPMEKEVEPK